MVCAVASFVASEALLWIWCGDPPWHHRSEGSRTFCTDPPRRFLRDLGSPGYPMGGWGWSSQWGEAPSLRTPARPYSRACPPFWLHRPGEMSQMLAGTCQDAGSQEFRGCACALGGWACPKMGVLQQWEGVGDCLLLEFSVLRPI